MSLLNDFTKLTINRLNLNLSLDISKIGKIELRSFNVEKN